MFWKVCNVFVPLSYKIWFFSPDLGYYKDLIHKLIPTEAVTKSESTEEEKMIDEMDKAEEDGVESAAEEKMINEMDKVEKGEVEET